MKKNGYYNKFDFIDKLNNNFVGKLDNTFVEMLEKIYNRKLDKNQLVLCWKSFKTDKADIVVCINNIKKFISIKNGKNNSVHLESISEFKTFLKENNISDELIKIYDNYHYATDNKGQRQGAKEYQNSHFYEIELFNNAINKKHILHKALDRFLFKGTHDYNNRVNAIIYGNIDNFVCITYTEVMNYLLNVKEKFNSIHFILPFTSLLTLQPWTRNLNHNEKYEYRRDYVQAKWYRLEEIVEKINKF